MKKRILLLFTVALVMAAMMVAMAMPAAAKVNCSTSSDTRVCSGGFSTTDVINGGQGRHTTLNTSTFEFTISGGEGFGGGGQGGGDGGRCADNVCVGGGSFF